MMRCGAVTVVSGSKVCCDAVTVVSGSGVCCDAVTVIAALSKFCGVAVIAAGDAVVVVVSRDIALSREVFGVTNADADVVSRDIALLEEVLGTGCEEGRSGSSPVISAMLVLMGMVLSFLSCRFLLRESRLGLLVDDRVLIEGGMCRWWYQPTPWKVFAGLQPSKVLVDTTIYTFHLR